MVHPTSVYDTEARQRKLGSQAFLLAKDCRTSEELLPLAICHFFFYGAPILLPSSATLYARVTLIDIT